ncbi:hypothetical protein C8039_07520 [Halogeometricum sp. wsp3]|nr:hypothetical protein C8039_07520 [Halogeometricum sp. wsp3]
MSRLERVVVARRSRLILDSIELRHQPSGLVLGHKVQALSPSDDGTVNDDVCAVNEYQDNAEDDCTIET